MLSHSLSCGLLPVPYGSRGSHSLAFFLRLTDCIFDIFWFFFFCFKKHSFIDTIFYFYEKKEKKTISNLHDGGVVWYVVVVWCVYRLGDEG